MLTAWCTVDRALKRANYVSPRISQIKEIMKRFFFGDGVRARALRGTALSVLDYGGGNFLRLLSNLILTRLLFPQAFGLMALVQVFVSGLEMFSDLGIQTSIIQHKRGDEPAFQNTAWTMQVFRGVALWLGSCALAFPAAALYDEPMLRLLLPVAGLNALIAGFNPTSLALARRHLKLGRVTAIQLLSRTIGIVAMILLALMLKSVWALAIGGLIGSIANTSLLHLLLPGIKNRFQWDRPSSREVFGFGKFIFFSTIAGFLLMQGDRAILGAYADLSILGIYSIAFFLGTVPFDLSNVISSRIVFPLYRMRPPAESIENRKKLFKARRLIVSIALTFSAILTYSGVWLVNLLYDDRYAAAGAMIVLFGLSSVPRIVGIPYQGVLLANGDSKRLFFLQATTALLQTGLMFAGVIWFGIFGVILASGTAWLITFPLRALFANQYKAFDKVADIGFLLLGLTVNGLACWLHWDEILKLIG